jgi:hypothetical protein
MNLSDLLHWIRHHKSAAVGLVLVVAACLSLLRLAHRLHHLPPRARPAAAAAAASDAASATGGTGGLTSPAAPGTEQNGRTARMRSEFENATDYFAFIQQAIGRPAEGGKFYALLAWKRCNDLGRRPAAGSLIVGNEAFHDGAAALIEDIEKRCIGVLDTWPGVQALYDLAMQQRGGKDLLVPENGRGIVTPAGRGTANADIDAALHTGDRWAEAEALENNAHFLDVGNSAGDDGVDRQLHEWSAEIVACELVGDCHGGVQAALHCVDTGDCVHDVATSCAPRCPTLTAPCSTRWWRACASAWGWRPASPTRVSSRPAVPPRTRAWCWAGWCRRRRPSHRRWPTGR